MNEIKLLLISDILNKKKTFFFLIILKYIL